MENEGAIIKNQFPLSVDEEETSITNNSKTNSFSNGRWTEKEHIRFLRGCLIYRNNWKKVEKFVKTRSSSQIRSHAQKYLIKLNKKYKIGAGSPFSHTQKYIKSINNKLEKELMNKVIKSLSNPDVNLENVERIILDLFFMEVPQKNDDDFCQEKINDIIKNTKELNNGMSCEDIEKEKEKRGVFIGDNKKIFECEKTPKIDALVTLINNKLNSCKSEDFYTILSWLTKKDSLKADIIKKLIYSDYNNSLISPLHNTNENYSFIINNNAISYYNNLINT